jgi:hypothetical protein
MTGFQASNKQRKKVRHSVCSVCFNGPGCDPAHLTARAQGGCEHEDCVIPLCRACHTMFDRGDLNLEPLIALRQFALERAHMAFHMSYRQCIQRLSGVR